MLTLAQYLEEKNVAPSDFARRLSARLGRPVSQQNIYRWTRPQDHPEYSIPKPLETVAIYFETGRLVDFEGWYRHVVRNFRRLAKEAA